MTESNPKLKKRKISAFLLFLALSFSFWLLINLSKEYSSKLAYKIEYNDLPDRFLFVQAPPEMIKVNVESTGFKLLKEYLFNKKIQINLSDLNSDKDGYFIDLDQQILRVNAEHGDVKMRGFDMNRLDLKLDVLDQKYVPVILNQNISYASGYHHDGNYHINPDSILITGSEKKLELIDEIFTKTLSLNNVRSSVDQEVGLDVSKFDSDLKLSDKLVRVKFEVEKYTEGRFEMEIKILNKPKGKQVLVFPNKVSLYYQSGLSTFDFIQPTDFVIEGDLETSIQMGLDFLELEVSTKNKDVSFYRLEPRRVEFLIVSEE